MLATVPEPRRRAPICSPCSRPSSGARPLPATRSSGWASCPFRDLGFARVDTHRELRQGAPEAILAEGKTPEEVEAIARALLESGAGSVLVTRADAAAREALRRVAPDAEEDERARLAWVARDVPAVARAGRDRLGRDLGRPRW